MRSLDGRSGSPNPQGIPTELRVFDTTLQGFEQALDILLADSSGANRCDLARMLLPRLRRLLARLEGACETTSDAKSLCESCQQKTSCIEMCEQLRAHLNGPYAGKLHGETTAGTDLDEIRARRGSPEGLDGDEKASQEDRGALGRIRGVESFDPLEQYRPCSDLLSEEQKEVVQMRHGEGKKIKEIAATLGKSPSTVSTLLKRAWKVKEEHRKEMWRVQLAVRRESGANSDEL